MDRTAAVLTHVDLINIGIQQVGLVVVPLQDHGHHRFTELAPQGAPVVEEIVLHQLLRDGAAALGHLATAQVDPYRTQQRLRVDAVMSTRSGDPRPPSVPLRTGG